MANEKVICDKADLVAIADAVREKNGSSDTYYVSELAEAVEAISGGGGGNNIEIEIKTVNPVGDNFDVTYSLPRVTALYGVPSSSAEYGVGAIVGVQNTTYSYVAGTSSDKVHFNKGSIGPSRTFASNTITFIPDNYTAFGREPLTLIFINDPSMPSVFPWVN